VETGLWLAIEAPSDERDGNRYAKPTATAPHLDSTNMVGSREKKADGDFVAALLHHTAKSSTPNQAYALASRRYNSVLVKVDIIILRSRYKLPKRSTGGGQVSCDCLLFFSSEVGSRFILTWWL